MHIHIHKHGCTGEEISPSGLAVIKQGRPLPTCQITPGVVDPREIALATSHLVKREVSVDVDWFTKKVIDAIQTVVVSTSTSSIDREVRPRTMPEQMKIVISVPEKVGILFEDSAEIRHVGCVCHSRHFLVRAFGFGPVGGVEGHERRSRSPDSDQQCAILQQ